MYRLFVSECFARLTGTEYSAGEKFSQSHIGTMSLRSCGRIAEVAARWHQQNWRNEETQLPCSTLARK
jgi:hypothetical protein